MSELIDTSQFQVGAEVRCRFRGAKRDSAGRITAVHRGDDCFSFTVDIELDDDERFTRVWPKAFYGPDRQFWFPAALLRS